MGRIWALKGRKTGSDPYCVYSKPLKSCFTKVKEEEGLGGGRKRIPSLGSKRNPEPWLQARPQALGASETRALGASESRALGASESRALAPSETPSFGRKRTPSLKMGLGLGEARRGYERLGL
jgi:hypothetical protein